MPGRLEGRRILVLRPEGQAADLARALAAEGAEPVIAPAIRILPPAEWAAIEAALLGDHDWLVFTSVNGVHAITGRLDPGSFGSGGTRRIAAIGPATADALRSSGLTVDFVPSAYTTVALGRELPLPDGGRSGTVCLVRADIAGGDLESILAGRGFSIDRVDAYRTEPEEPGAITSALDQGLDGIALTSASITGAFAAAAGNPPDTRGAGVFCIGPATAAACRAAGIEVTAEAAVHTIQGLVGIMADSLGALGPPGTRGPARMAVERREA